MCKLVFLFFYVFEFSVETSVFEFSVEPSVFDF